jgi:hypothetical protein
VLFGQIYRFQPSPRFCDNLELWLPVQNAPKALPK